MAYQSPPDGQVNPFGDWCPAAVLGLPTSRCRDGVPRPWTHGLAERWLRPLSPRVEGPEAAPGWVAAPLGDSYDNGQLD